MEQSNIAASRADALTSGKPFYIGPKPCQRGHDPAIRRTGSKACHSCALEYDRHKRANDPARQASERKRKNEAKKRARRAGTFNKEARNRYESERRERARNRPEAIAARQAREAALQAKREARKQAKRDALALRALEQELSADDVRARQVQHNRNKAKQRRSLKRGANGKVSNQDLADLKAQQSGKCAYCGSEAAYLDHKVSVANGGAHELSNLQWLCAPCNLHKHSMNDLAYRVHYGVPMVTPWDTQEQRRIWAAILAI
jgi:5-methylcytosine-specific restriction endonuclease McrA